MGWFILNVVVWVSLDRWCEGRKVRSMAKDSGLREQPEQMSWGRQESFSLLGKTKWKPGQLSSSKQGRSTVRDEVGGKGWGQELHRWFHSKDSVKLLKGFNWGIDVLFIFNFFLVEVYPTVKCANLNTPQDKTKVQNISITAAARSRTDWRVCL